MSRPGTYDDSSNNDGLDTSRHNVLTTIDSFIEQIIQVRETLFGVSISGLVLAPLAIGLSLFLLQHPSFFAVLEIENEFGIVLGVSLIAVIVISSIWLLGGVKQYRSINSWNKRYKEYRKEMQEIDTSIKSIYGFDN